MSAEPSADEIRQFSEYMNKLEEVEDLENATGGSWIFKNTLWVYQTYSGASIRVSPEGPPQDERGGYLLLDTSSPEKIHDWLSAKIECYEELL